MYINQAQVAITRDQRGRILTGSGNSCVAFTLGGDSDGTSGYRGTVEELRLWDRALSHEELISQGPTYSRRRHNHVDNDIIISEDFDDVMLSWNAIDEQYPKLIPSDLKKQRWETVLMPGRCGRTVCDNSDVIRSYTNNPELRSEKVVRYRIVNVYNDDGSEPQLTKEQIQLQHKKLSNAFRPYNILWNYEELPIHNSSLRHKVALSGCSKDEVGNGRCDIWCNHTVTGFDGGDCDTSLSFCDSQLIGNGNCDIDCNKHYHSWDGGDCCIHADSTWCFDPESPNRYVTQTHREQVSFRNYY